MAINATCPKIFLPVPKNRWCEERSPYCDENIYKLFFEHVMKPDICSIENSVDPDQLASSSLEAS